MRPLRRVYASPSSDILISVIVFRNLSKTLNLTIRQHYQAFKVLGLKVYQKLGTLNTIPIEIMALARTIDHFFQKAPAPAAALANSKKRSLDSFAAGNKSAKTKKQKPRQNQSSKKSTKHIWTSPHSSSAAPSGPNAQKRVENWNLLAPYDTRITEEQLGEY